MKWVTPYSFCNYSYIVPLMVIFLVHKSSANDYYQEVHEISSQITNTITVDLNGLGNYKTVQSAVNAIPNQNQNWIHILIKEGIYNEKVMIPKDKGYIYMQGAGIEKTIIAYNDPRFTSFFNDTSSTFTAYPDNIIISGITFKNTYNTELKSTSLATPIKPALAARMLGDKYLVIDSSFDGFQDTLYDCLGRHYYRRCVISGVIDFIYGYAQSIFEGCTLNLTMGIYAPPGRTYGTITAQGRQSPNDKGGFVFKDCTVTGSGKVLLGRAWEPYARVIFYRSTLSDAILPIGWDAWNAKGQERDTTFVEYNCTGAGADTSHRVPWLTKASTRFLNLTSVSSINQEGWLNKLPITLNKKKLPIGATDDEPSRDVCFG